MSSGEANAKADAAQAREAAKWAKDMLELQQKHSKDMIVLLRNQNAEKTREESFQEWKRENQQKADELEKANEQLQKNLDNAETEFVENAVDPQKYEEKQLEFFQAFCDKVAEIQTSKKTAIPSVAVVGQNGVGKSSMINSLVGKEVTCTGVVDTTKNVYMCHENSHAQFYDVPGCSDERAYTNLKSIMAMKEMHLIMITYIDRVEHITKLERLVIACKVPYIIVRNKIDEISEAEAKKQNLSRAELLKETYECEKRKVKGDLVFVSAHTKEGLDELRRAAQQKASMQLTEQPGSQKISDTCNLVDVQAMYCLFVGPLFAQVLISRRG